jgi:hypothetical protein
MGGTRSAGYGRLLAPILLLCATAASAQSPPAATTPRAPAATIIVLDGSRGMWTRIGGQSKVAIVRSSLGQAFKSYEDRVAFGLVAFGHREGKTCAEPELMAKPGELSSKTPGKLLFGAGFKPKLGRPIAAALVEAAKQTPAAGLDVLLITDGLDSCKANVCATVKALKQAAPQLRMHVIGFDPKAKQTVKALACVAQATGGQFLTAATATELKKDLSTVLEDVIKARPQPLPADRPAVASAPENPPAATSAPVTASAPAPASPAPEASLPPSEAQNPQPPVPPVTAAPPAAPQVASPPPAAAGQTAPAETALSKTVQPQSTPPPVQAEPVLGPPAPPETSIPKIAAIAPKENAAPARVPGATSNAPVPVTFKALLTEAGPMLKSGIVWRVFQPRPGPDGTRKLVSTHREAVPTAALPPGEYLVNAAYGLSNLTRKIKVESGRSVEETFVLNTGGLKLAAMLVSGVRLSQSSVRFDILSDEEDQFGNRRKIMENAKPGLVIRLNAGAYHIVSLYGDANATVRADVTVEPGKITEATIKHAAAPITFKLVQSAGGEALADTQWTILTTTGDVVKENAGALPTHILAAGDYAVVAKHNGESYTNKFSVVSGQPKQIEVVMESGPATAEALKAIIEPPPPPPSPEVAQPGGPGTPAVGLGFGAADGGTTPREPGLLPNPGALLRPRFP